MGGGEVRGLTDSERVVVEVWRDIVFNEDDDTPVRMLERGLIRITGECCDCGSPPAEDCDCEWICDQYAITKLGELALRVDAAARAAGVWP